MTSRSAHAGASAGVTDGVRALFGGIGFVVSTPAIWGWALVPVIAATLLFGGFGAAAVWSGARLAERLVGTPTGDWGAAGSWGLKLLFGFVGLIVAFLVAVSLAQPVSGFALEAIARRQEAAIGGRTWPDQPFVASTLRSLAVTLTALAITLPIVGGLSLVTFALPPAAIVTIPLKFLVTGLAVAYDFLDYPLGLRGAGVRVRLAFIRAHFGAVIGFGVTAAALLLVPGVGLLLLPFGVAGATRLVVRADHLVKAP